MYIVDLNTSPLGTIDSISGAIIKMLDSPEAIGLGISGFSFDFNGTRVPVLRGDTVDVVLADYSRRKRSGV